MSPLVRELDKVYEQATGLRSDVDCRKCANCCRQNKRFIQLYALEVAYLVKDMSDKQVSEMGVTGNDCPALGSEGTCFSYDNRPLGCRLFLPSARWSLISGCADYLHGRDSAREIGALLTQVEEVNHEFISGTGLFKDFRHDYFSQWPIEHWFN